MAPPSPTHTPLHPSADCSQVTQSCLPAGWCSFRKGKFSGPHKNRFNKVQKYSTNCIPTICFACDSSEKRNSLCLFSLCPLKAAGGDPLLLPMGSPLLPDTGPAVWPTQRLPLCGVCWPGPLACAAAGRLEISGAKGTAQPGGRSLGSSPNSNTCSSLHLAKPVSTSGEWV